VEQLESTVRIACLAEKGSEMVLGFEPKALCLGVVRMRAVQLVQERGAAS
jgi:hypothetical protein